MSISSVGSAGDGVPVYESEEVVEEVSKEETCAFSSQATLSRVSPNQRKLDYATRVGQLQIFASDTLEIRIERCRRWVARDTCYDPAVMLTLDQALKTWKTAHDELGDQFKIDTLLNATVFALGKHLGQFRKGPDRTPYIIHPIGVAQIVWDLGGVRDVNTLAAALLHDTLEDTETSEEEIKSLFGAEVLRQVQDLTNDESLSGQAMKQWQVDHAPHMCTGAKVVKLADRLYNITDLSIPNPPWGPEKVESYMTWAEKLSQALRGHAPRIEKGIEEVVSAYRKNLFPHGVYVGALGEKWQFPSDHLPIGASIDELEVVSWNVLSNRYLDWVTVHDTQGLNGSLISEVEPEVRDDIVVQAVLSMIEDPNHPKSLLCLQECSESFVSKLTQVLPEHMKLIENSENVVIYDATKLEFFPDRSSFPRPYEESSPKRTLMDLVFEGKGKTYRIINAHLPGDPQLPGRNEFASYVNQAREEGEVLIATGDMNFERHEMIEAFLNHGELQPFALLSPYPTNIGLDLRSKAIDHFYVVGTSHWTVRQPEEVLEGLSNTVELLTTPADNT